MLKNFYCDKMCLKFLLFPVIFALISKDCLAFESCNNALSNKNGYCVPIRECRYFWQIKSILVTKSMKDIFVKSFCSANKRIICCAEEDIIQSITTTTTTPKSIPTTTLAPEVITAKRNEGTKLLQSYKKSCGKKMLSNVLSGNGNIQIGQYPWMALLVYNKLGLEYRCGGSLITNRHILTAAHCFNGDLPDKVLLGVRNTSMSTEYIYGPLANKSFHVETYNIAKFAVHSQYNVLLNQNDIALITLDRFVTTNNTQSGKFTAHIKPICLPITETSKKNNKTEYTVAGWGFTKNRSETLMSSQLKLQPLDYCREQLKDEYVNVTINENQICAGGDSGQDNCKKYSGGPLFYFGPFNKRSRRYVQHGITSFSKFPCGAQASPIIYTKVFPYLDWIAENIV